VLSVEVNRRTNTPPISGRTSGRRRLLLPVLMAFAMVVAFASATAADAGKPKAHAAAPQTLKKTVWGPTILADGSSPFPVWRDLGVGNFAIAARWGDIAPTTRPADPKNPNDPAYEWPAHLAKEISEAESHGMKVQILLMGTPPWANGGKSWEWIPDDPQDFADFATAVSRKFPSVHQWMIWGEPNRKPNFRPLTPAPNRVSAKAKLSKAQQVGPHNYAVLLDAAYEAIKAEGANDKVIGGNTYTSAGRDSIRTYQWIKYMKLPNGRRPRMDMWGHNPWGFSKPNFKDPPSPNGTVEFSDLKRLAAALDDTFPGRPLKLYLAEWGVPTGAKDLDLGYTLKAKEATSWVKAAFKLARWKRIATVGWIHTTDTDRNSTGFFDVNGAKKATYDAFKAAR
jgi:hypothetical protein